MSLALSKRATIPWESRGSTAAPWAKVENCQVGVFAAYASRQGYALVDKRLFLPDAWFTDAYAARRTKCHLPTELGFQSKPQLAATMLQAIAHEGLLPFK